MGTWPLKLILAILLISLIATFTSAAGDTKKKSDPNDNRGNTPFFLQDPYDDMCLGPHGFTMCNEQGS